MQTRFKNLPYFLRTALVTLLCAGVVLLMRFGRIPAFITISERVIFPLSDFFIMVGAGLCGHLWALGMFLVIFFTEFVLRNGLLIDLFPLFLYLVLALTSSIMAEHGWYRKKPLALCAFLILEAELCVIFYVIFVRIFGGMQSSFWGTLVWTSPETSFAVILLWLFFRFVPDGAKKSFGIGRVYASDFADRRSRKPFTRSISLLSLSEAVIFGFISVLTAEAMLRYMAENARNATFESGTVGRIMSFLFSATASLSLAVIVNEIVIKIVVAVVKKQESRSAHLTEGFMLALAKSVDAKDHYTSGHSERVAQYAREIARRLGKSETEQDDIYTMGLLHDIGKIGVSEAIINKNGRLTDEEFAEIKKHPLKGYEILQNVKEIPALATGARWHHERYDGRGYPDGLSGETIPEEARIIAVADAYDAMTSKRAYSDVRPQSQVRAEIERCKGSQFDPKIADVMLGMIDDDTDYKMHEGGSK